MKYCGLSFQVRSLTLNQYLCFQSDFFFSLSPLPVEWPRAGLQLNRYLPACLWSPWPTDSLPALDHPSETQRRTRSDFLFVTFFLDYRQSLSIHLHLNRSLLFCTEALQTYPHLSWAVFFFFSVWMMCTPLSGGRLRMGCFLPQVLKEGTVYL